MKLFPATKDSPVLRTDFSNDAAWNTVCEEIQKPSDEGFYAFVEFIVDPAFGGLNKQQLLACVPENYFHSFILVADPDTFLRSERSLLVINLDNRLESEIGDEFRCIIPQIWAVQNNLSISNMDFADFADAVDAAGVFRGF